MMTMEEKLAHARGETEVMRNAVRQANKGVSRLAHKVKTLTSLLDEQNDLLEGMLPKAYGNVAMKKVVSDLFTIVLDVASAPSVVNEATGMVEIAVPAVIIDMARKATGATRQEVANAE